MPASLLLVIDTRILGFVKNKWLHHPLEIPNDEELCGRFSSLSLRATRLNILKSIK
jgi:hypothetical protein